VAGGFKESLNKLLQFSSHLHSSSFTFLFHFGCSNPNTFSFIILVEVRTMCATLFNSISHAGMRLRFSLSTGGSKTLSMIFIQTGISDILHELMKPKSNQIHFNASFVQVQEKTFLDLN